MISGGEAFARHSPAGSVRQVCKLLDQSRAGEAGIRQLRHLGHAAQNAAQRGGDAAPFDPDLAIVVGAVEESPALIRHPLVSTDIAVRTLGKNNQLALALVDAFPGGASH